MTPEEIRAINGACAICGHDFFPPIPVLKAPSAPKPGDLCVCIGCLTPFRFDETFKLQPLSLSDLRRLLKAEGAEP